jgi:hypothetical protein
MEVVGKINAVAVKKVKFALNYGQNNWNVRK